LALVSKALIVSFLVEQLYRVLQPGRLIAIHCMNLTASKGREGYIGIRDFRGDLIRKHIILMLGCLLQVAARKVEIRSFKLYTYRFPSHFYSGICFGANA
jgi:hypothetical protein